MIVSYKSRNINFDKPVRIYRNLNMKGGKWYSIKQDGLVVGHFKESIRFEDCKFIVNHKARKRVIQNKRREVHAYIEGKLIAPAPILTDDVRMIYYDPFDIEYDFSVGSIWKRDKTNIAWSEFIIITGGRIYSCGKRKLYDKEDV